MPRRYDGDGFGSRRRVTKGVDLGRRGPILYEDEALLVAKKAAEIGTTRTVALIGHRSSGKTSLAEAALFVAGVVRSAGSIDSRTTLLDHTPESRRRGATMEPEFAWLPWREFTIQLVDTPGSLALSDARDGVLAGVDAAIVVVDGSAGVQLGTIRALERCRALGLPVVVAINKADRSLPAEELLESLQAVVEGVAIPMALPMPGEAGEPALVGVVDVATQRLWRFLDDASGRHSVEPLPDPKPWGLSRECLLEAVALADDDLLDHYLEFFDLPADAIATGLAAAVRARAVTPVVFTSAVNTVAFSTCSMSSWMRFPP